MKTASACSHDKKKLTRYWQNDTRLNKQTIIQILQATQGLKRFEAA